MNTGRRRIRQNPPAAPTGRWSSTMALTVLAMVSSAAVSADCSVTQPSPLRTLAVSLGDPQMVTIACTEDCTITTSTSGVSSGSFEVMPAEQFIPAGGQFAFTVSASGFDEDGDRGRGQFEYSCGSSNTVELVIDTPAQQVIEHKQGGTDSDPVSTRNGELFQLYPPDLNLGGPLPLFFQRYYSSNLATDGNIESNLGTNWLHNFSWRLDPSRNNVQLITNRGRAVRFLESGSNWVLAHRRDIPFQLNENNDGSYTLIDPRDQLIYTFSLGGVLLSVGDANGNLLTLSQSFDPSTGLQIDTISDGLGRTLTFGHQNGVMKSVSDGTRTVSFQQTGDDLTEVVDARGHATTYSYAAGGLMTATTRPEGNTPFTQTFGAGGEVQTQTDAGGNTTTFAYAPPDTTLIDAAADTRSHTHTDAGVLSASVDRSGQSVQIAVDSQGRRQSITDRLGDTTSFTWDDTSGNPASVGHADGTSQSYSYTDRAVGDLTMRDLSGMTHTDGATEAWVFDPAGNATAYTNRLGQTATATYDAAGRRLTRTNTAGGTATTAWNPNGTPAAYTTPDAHTTSYGYDGLLRRNLITHPDTSTTAFAWDANDNLTSLTNENGVTTSFTWDTNNNLTSRTNPLGSTQFTYDDNDRLLTRTDPVGGTITFARDPLGRLQTITDANGNTLQYERDVLGRVATVTDPLSGQSQFTWDAEGVQTTTTDRTGQITRFETDAMGRGTAVTTPLENRTEYTYDSKGRLTALANPLDEVTTYNYDAGGRIASIVLAEPGVAMSLTRDPLGLPTQVIDPNGNSWNWTADSQGRRTSSTDPLVRTTSYAYDNRGRAASVTFPNPAETLTITYDAAGNRTADAYSDGTTVSYAFDAADRLVSGTGLVNERDAAGRIIDSNGITVTRDPGGRITSLLLAPGVTISYTYDGNNNVVSVSDSLGATTTLGYDAEDRVTSITRDNGLTTTQEWDADGRLVAITEGDAGSITLTRDGAGQIISATRTLPLAGSSEALDARSSSFDAAAQITGASYDDLGRVTQDGSNTFTWNLASRLVQYSVDADTAEQGYDALGRRVSRTTAGTTHTFVWNDALILPSVAIERIDGADHRYDVHLPSGALLYSINAVSDQRRYHHFDEMGNTVFTSDDAGDVVASFVHTPYGEVIEQTGESDTPYTWQGRWGVAHEGHGLYYMRERWYDSRRMRFLSRDPVQSIDPREINPYQYARANPMANLDPTGLRSFEEREQSLKTGAGAAAGGGALFVGSEVAVVKTLGWSGALAEAGVASGPVGLAAAGGALLGIALGNVIGFFIIDPIYADLRREVRAERAELINRANELEEQSRQFQENNAATVRALESRRNFNARARTPITDARRNGTPESPGYLEFEFFQERRKSNSLYLTELPSELDRVTTLTDYGQILDLRDQAVDLFFSPTPRSTRQAANEPSIPEGP